MRPEFRTEIELDVSLYNSSVGIMNILDDMLHARDELFEKKLIEGLLSQKPDRLPQLE